MSERVLTMGFLYSINTGKLVVRTGVVALPETPIKKLEDEHLYSRKRINICKFYVDDTNGRVIVSEEPGVVYHRCVWLPVRDDNKAKNLFVNSEIMKIKLLEKEIEKHNSIINSLGYISWKENDYET